MPDRSLSLAFVMDPIERVDVEADTTFALMLEAQSRGHRVLYVRPQDLSVRERRAVAYATAVTLRREKGHHVDLGESRSRVLDDDVDVVFQRVDPPVDAAYVTTCQILDLCQRCRVINRPSSVVAANEKLYALNFPELMTETLVTRRIPELIDFMAKLGGEMIVKPLAGKGGEGIFHVSHDDRNLFSILEQATGFGTLWTMAQRYLPEIRKGDKRILLVDGEFLGAVLRVPAERETRANLHVGGSALAADLDDDDRRIIATLAPRLRANGLFFVGIDVIGGCLTEINVTSPTGIQEASRLMGRPLETAVLERVERLVAGAA